VEEVGADGKGKEAGHEEAEEIDRGANCSGGDWPRGS